MYTHESEIVHTKGIHFDVQLYTYCIQMYSLLCILFVQKEYTFCISNLGKGNSVYSCIYCKVVNTGRYVIVYGSPE